MNLTAKVHQRLRSGHSAPARVSTLGRSVANARLTYLGATKLASLERCLRQIDSDAVDGDVLEAGVALGGSAIMLAGGMSPGRCFHGYDVFGMIPPPSEHDDSRSHERYAVIASGTASGINGDEYYGYETDLYQKVVANFAAFGVPVDGKRVVLHRGLFEDTLHPDGPVALAHVDSDWYGPVRQCLERIHPHLSPGGYIVLDDFFTYGGCARAAHEYLAANSDLRMISASAHAIIQRRPDAAEHHP